MHILTPFNLLYIAAYQESAKVSHNHLRAVVFLHCPEQRERPSAEYVINAPEDRQASKPDLTTRRP